MAKNGLVKIDLDAFLGTVQEDDASQKTLLEEPKRMSRSMPDSDRITVVGIFVDDSGSIQECGLQEAMISSVNNCIDALKSAKGADFYLNIQGFMKTYYDGLLKNAGAFGTEYHPVYSNTPLVQYTLQHYRDLQTKIADYSAQGIPATIAYLIITDGLPNNDYTPDHFKRHINNRDFIVGIGVRRQDTDIAAYREVFKNMGIQKVMTPQASGSEIRHAVNEFSRSVVSEALR